VTPFSANGACAFGGNEATPTTSRSWTTTRRHDGDQAAPVHPGEILLGEFLEPAGLSQYRLAKDISVPSRRINEIVHDKRSVTAETALRLARYFGTTPRFWLNLQAQYDLDVEGDRLGARLDREVTAHAS
jgi:antitoxin HigA-1